MRGRWIALGLTCALPVFALAGCAKEQPGAAAELSATPSASIAPEESASAAPDPAAAPTDCAEVKDVSVFFSPRAPRTGEPLRVMVVSETERQGTLSLEGAATAAGEARHGGPPYWWYAEIASAPAGSYTAHLRGAGVHVCVPIDVRDDPPPRPPAKWSSVWPIERAWDRAVENLFGAWLEKLFEAPATDQTVWRSLSELVRDPKRNFLFNHAGLGEDGDKGHIIEPDCADLPYTLRAYFAFKMGLPLGYSRCTRGTATAAPTCARWSSSLTANKDNADPVLRVSNFMRVTLANAVHSGTVRVKGDDDLGDFYPVELSSTALRPGTVYADPYGHILIVVSRVAQTATSGGQLFAVDGQPDNTISRRRFWRGNFLFHDDPVYGGPGFKRFRPVVLAGIEGRPLKNAEIEANADWGDFSLEQYTLGIDGFYDKVDQVLSPAPREPAQAFLETIDALDEQVRRRVVSVDNALPYLKTHPGTIDMPAGAEIFETTGGWEDFSTPSRDMRLLIGMDVLAGLAKHIVAQPARWKLPPGKTMETVEKELGELLDSETKKRRFSYTRSDGSSWDLTLADVLARQKAFEMAYNPNDCPEQRWGAPKGSPEASTCRRRATPAQLSAMETYRTWFASRTRPPRP